MEEARKKLEEEVKLVMRCFKDGEEDEEDASMTTIVQLINNSECDWLNLEAIQNLQQLPKKHHEAICEALEVAKGYVVKETFKSIKINMNRKKQMKEAWVQCRQCVRLPKLQLINIEPHM